MDIMAYQQKFVKLELADLTILGRQQAFIRGKPFYRETAESLTNKIYQKEYPDGRIELVEKEWVQDGKECKRKEKMIKVIEPNTVNEA